MVGTIDLADAPVPIGSALVWTSASRIRELRPHVPLSVRGSDAPRDTLPACTPRPASARRAGRSSPCGSASRTWRGSSGPPPPPRGPAPPGNAPPTRSRSTPRSGPSPAASLPVQRRTAPAAFGSAAPPPPRSLSGRRSGFHLVYLNAKMLHGWPPPFAAHDRVHHCGASATTRGGGQPLHPIFWPITQLDLLHAQRDAFNAEVSRIQ